MTLKKRIIGLGIALVFLVFSAGLLVMNMNSQPIDKITLQNNEARDGSSFEIIPSHQHKDIFDIYKQLNQEMCPQLITTDLVLHSTHLLYDYSEVPYRGCYCSVVDLLCSFSIDKGDPRSGHSLYGYDTFDHDPSFFSAVSWLRD